MTAGGLHKILYVEDDRDIQRIAQLALERIGGFEIKLCGSGQEALAEVGGFAPDLILLDIMLPEMDGLTILDALQRDAGTAGIPVVFMTARVQAEDVAEYRQRGALDVIFKPFDPMTLADRLREIWLTRQP